MLENYLVLIYLCLIVALQSSIGVGVLVLGTPFLLLLKYDILQAFFFLLPLSILTSLINLIIIRLSNKNLNISTYKGLTKFFVVCIPSIIIGLFILKYFQELINFPDNEGLIGPIASERLYQDFVNYESKIDKAVDWWYLKMSETKEYNSEDVKWFKSKYNDWKHAFDIARNNGMVIFH